MIALDTIPIDFVAGSHGNYLETVCNQGFGIVPRENNFTKHGTSHSKSHSYKKQKVFDARHWFSNYFHELQTHSHVISIRYQQDDLLLLSSVSLLRSGDYGINNDQLEHNTVTKLNNLHYKNVLEQLYQAYPFLDRNCADIPRWVLREFYKFGFRDPNINGYWKEQQKMCYGADQQVFDFEFGSFYNIDQFARQLADLANFLNTEFEFVDDFYATHEKFLSYIPYRDHKQQCDQIINYINNSEIQPIPPLTLFQESYINGCLENLYHKEMPFHQDKYFTSTKDVLYYLEHLAPNL